MIQSIKPTLPSLKDIKNVDYVQSKTKADKFAQIISEHAQVKPIDNNISSLRENDKYIDSDNNIEITTDKIDEYIPNTQETKNEPNRLNFPLSSKTTAHKFIQQIKTEEYKTDDFNQINFVDIEDSNKKLKTLSLPKIGVKDIKEISFKNEVNEHINNLPLPKNLIDKIRVSLINNINSNNINFSSEPKKATNDLLGQIINERTKDLIKSAEELEGLLNLELTGEISNIELNFFEKLREIISSLDKALYDNYKKSDDLKKDSKVEVKIKRFDIRDLKNISNKKI
jgi:hypothetical protein